MRIVCQTCPGLKRMIDTSLDIVAKRKKNQNRTTKEIMQMVVNQMTMPL